MTIRPNSQNARILYALKDKRWHSSADIQRRAGSTVRINSRIAELRSEHGYEIEHREVQGKARKALAHQYRLINPPPEVIALDGNKPKRTVLNRDEVKRTPKTRYRIYRVIRGDLELVAACATPAQVGHNLVSLGKKGEFSESCVGILDTYGTDTTQGTWCISPWDVEPLS